MIDSVTLWSLWLGDLGLYGWGSKIAKEKKNAVNGNSRKSKGEIRHFRNPELLFIFRVVESKHRNQNAVTPLNPFKQWLRTVTLFLPLILLFFFFFFNNRFILIVLSAFSQIQFQSQSRIAVKLLSSVLCCGPGWHKYRDH